MASAKVPKDKIVSVRLDYDSFIELMKRIKPNESKSIFLRRVIKEYICYDGDYLDNNRSSSKVR